MSSTTTLTAAAWPTPSERMPIPRSVWWVGALMLVLMLALLEGLASTAPDPRPVVDLRAVRLAPRPPVPATGPVWLATLPPAASAVAPWSSAALFPAMPGLQPALAQPACRTCGVVESVKPLQTARGGAPAQAAAPRAASVDARASVVRSGGSAATVPAVGDPAVLPSRSGRGTVYRVRVRMDDGSLRTLTQRNAPIIGARVVVAGRTLRPARGDASVLLGA
jgi:outer membrane lipoprotein SlyB